MSVTTEQPIAPSTDSSAEEKLEAIKTNRGRLIEIESKSPPVIGSIVLIGSDYQRDSLRLAIVEKIDGKGLIHTDTGIRFSTKFYEIKSTQKINDRYWTMFHLEESYDRALKWHKEQLDGKLRRKYLDLELAIKRLNPIADAALVDSLMQAIESHQSS